MILNLDEVKLYLRIDGDEENTLITKLILTAEDLVEGIIRYPLSEFQEVPEAIRQAILYAVANMFEHRETFQIKEIINTMINLVFSYRKEEW